MIALSDLEQMQLGVVGPSNEDWEWAAHRDLPAAPPRRLGAKRAKVLGGQVQPTYQGADILRHRELGRVGSWRFRGVSLN